MDLASPTFGPFDPLTGLVGLTVPRLRSVNDSAAPAPAPAPATPAPASAVRTFAQMPAARVATPAPAGGGRRALLAQPGAGRRR